MNAGPVEPQQAAGPVPRPEGREEGWPAGPKRSEGWSRRRWMMLVALVFTAQLGFILLFGARHFASPRAAANAPMLKLAADSDELLALDDPTLFALPHAQDFASAIWLQTRVAQPEFGWTKPPGELQSPAAEYLGAAFARFMQTNRFTEPPLDFKPPSKSSAPLLQLQPVFAENSTLQIEGDLAQRKLLTVENLPSWPWTDVIAPSKVQVLVDTAGAVVSAVLLPSDNGLEAAAYYDPADQRALELAHAARFAPASRPTIGRLVFNWRTVAPPPPNPPGGS